MLEDLIGRCNVRQLELTNSVIARRKPVMYSDFTRSFSRVLSIYIFSFLDPRSLCRCARVMAGYADVTVVGIMKHHFLLNTCETVKDSRLHPPIQSGNTNIL